MEELNHIYLIGDGHRRFAKKRGLSFEASYSCAAVALRNCLKWILVDEGIKEFSLFVFSMNNVLRRGDGSMEILWDLQNKKLKEFIDDPLIHDNEIRIKVLGERSLYPKDSIKIVESIEKATANYTKRQFNMLSAYSGAKDLEQAVSKTIEKNQSLTYERFLENSYISRPIDLAVRTANESRLSDSPFLATRYSEFIAYNKFFPELSKKDIKKMVREYVSRRGTTFGK